MRTPTNKKEIVTKVSEIEFQAALAAFQEIQNSDIPGACDEDDSVRSAKAYWGIGTMKSFDVTVSEEKPTMMKRLRAYFA